MKDYTQTPLNYTEAVISDGVALPTLPVYRQPLQDQFVVIDWLSVTFNINSIDVSNINHKADRETDPVAYAHYLDAVASKISEELESIVGFGIFRETASGQNFYDKTFILQHNTGSISLGGQRDTVLLTLNGTGCTYADQAYQYHLLDWLRTLHKVKITRIDLAFDDINGQLISPDWADKQDDIGGFTNKGRSPTIQKYGNWKRPDGKGLTVYIGSKKSSKFCRVYEKGKQLGYKDSLWTRCEVQFKSKHYNIPLEVITEPTNFFILAYPCFDQLFDNSHITPKSFELIKQRELISMSTSVDITRHQFGNYIYALRDILKDDTAVLDLLTSKENVQYPERLDSLTIPAFREDFTKLTKAKGA